MIVCFEKLKLERFGTVRMLECADDGGGGNVWRLGGFRTHLINLFRSYRIFVFGSFGLLEHCTVLV